MNKARYLNDVPEVMGDIPEIKKAFHIANQANLTPEELDDQEKNEFFIQDQHNFVNKAVNKAVTKAVKQAVQEAMQDGRNLGIQEGIEQGIEQGAQQKAIEIAKKMLNLVDDRTICEVTGLSLDELEILKTSQE